MYTRVDIIGASASTAFYSKLVMSLKVIIRTLTKKLAYWGDFSSREGIGREIGGHLIYRRLVECCAVGPPMFDAESFNRRGDILMDVTRILKIYILDLTDKHMMSNFNSRSCVVDR